MNNKFRVLSVTIGCIIIVILLILIYVNKDTWFVQVTTIKYPDNCVEKYKGVTLITEECVQGRRLVEERKSGIYGGFIPNISDMGVKTEWNQIQP